MNNNIIPNNYDEKDMIILGKRKFNPNTNNEEEPKKKKRKITNMPQMNGFSYIDPKLLQKNNDNEMEKWTGHIKNNNNLFKEYEDFIIDNGNVHPLARTSTKIVSFNNTIINTTEIPNINNNNRDEGSFPKNLELKSTRIYTDKMVMGIDKKEQELLKREMELEEREKKCQEASEIMKNDIEKIRSFGRKMKEKGEYFERREKVLDNLEKMVSKNNIYMSSFVKNYKKYVPNSNHHPCLNELKNIRTNINNSYLRLCLGSLNHALIKSQYNQDLVNYLYKENQLLKKYLEVQTRDDFLDFHIKKALNKKNL